ncbi:unnamed protein product [Spirodela intermedia]|uniref:Transposon Ty3-I Gag-Pol polyprotein n=1 Tax=Spirodela intermedia TaxID=51605 RepID=A0ABN7E953_SPIIN|nr:unnamed protein product [Spirodela intermedia]
MKIGGIILGRPWLFDYDVQLMGRANTCSFMYRDCRLIWYLHTNKSVPKHDTTLTLPSLEVEGILLEYIDVLLEELPKELTRAFGQGLIQPSVSPCAMPALLVPKKDGTWHMCCNSRVINRITVKYHFPIPQLQDLFDMMTGATIFSKNRSM